MGQPDKAGRGRGGRAGDGRRAPHQLPSGRHGLLPSFVAANQRERILSAVAQAAAELGYVEMSVEAITARAGVSRRTFYEHFKNKEDAFLATYDALLHQLVMHTQRAYLQETAVMERLRAGISAYLQFLANEPEFARTCIVEVLAVGPRALARRNQAMRLFTEIIEDNIRELIPDFPRAAITAETIVGGIHEVVFNRILANRTDELPGLAEDLLTTTKGGQRLATTVGGAVAGFRAELTIIDDPMQPDEVASELKKQTLRDWYSGVVEQRLIPGGAMIVVMHRLAPDDFTATLLEKGGWFHISLPLIAVQEITYTDRSDRDFGFAGRAIC